MEQQVLINTVTAIFAGNKGTPQYATTHLNAIHKNFKSRLPWIASFSFARAIQQPALDTWKGQEANVEASQKLLYQRAKLDAAARRGEYIDIKEKI